MPAPHVVRCLLAGALLAVSGLAHSQLFRAYLSAAGNDSSPCTLSLPCRLLPAAVAAVADGGEIWMLDSANYNGTTVNIAKSITLLAEPGAIGSVVAAGGPAISITGNARVALVNLVVVPLPGGGGTYGVVMLGSGSLVVDKVTFARLAATALLVEGDVNVRISNTTFSDLASDGISIRGGAAADISDVKLSGVYNLGITSRSDSPGVNTRVSATNVTASGGTNCQYFAFSLGGTAQLYVTRSSAVNNVEAACAQGAGATLSLSGVSFQGNAYGAYTLPGGAIQSFGNNSIANNSSGDIAGAALVPVALQ